jgi:hypothetical protein
LKFSDFLNKNKSEFTWLLRAPNFLENGSQVFLKSGISDIHDLSQYIHDQIHSTRRKFAYGSYAEYRDSLSNLEKDKWIIQRDELEELDDYDENGS